MSEWLRRHSFAYWYWSGLLRGRFRLWQLLALGTGWIVLGIAFELFCIAETGSGSTSMLVVLCGSGLIHFWFAVKALGAQRVDEQAEPEAPRQRQVVEPPRPSPRNVGGDPFRSPPQSTIAVVKHESPRAPAPVVAGDPDDKPKLLG